MGATNDVLDQAYQDSWIPGKPNARNCSGFLKSAANRLGISLPEQNADGILQYLEGSAEWENIGTGEGALSKAVAQTLAKRFVVVGATAKDYGAIDGHVAVLRPKLVGPHHAPLVYCGSEGIAASNGNKTIRDVFSPKKFGVLKCFVHRTKKLEGFE